MPERLATAGPVTVIAKTIGQRFDDFLEAGHFLWIDLTRRRRAYLDLFGMQVELKSY
jgi:hypothetical protein